MYYKIYKRTLVTAILFFLCSSLTYAQKFNPQRLSEISDDQLAISDIQQERVLKYLIEYGYDKKSIDLGDGRKAILKDVLNNVPQYISTYNLQARKTTGVEHIQSASGLDLNLTGSGLTIGVWDGGQIFKDHVEFGSRIDNRIGAEYSDHATHVAGTIMAAGINPLAKGMLPEANVIGYYAFEDDLGPMAIEAGKGLILSNHSYGLILGWSYNPGSASWQWFGGSGDVDERFGHYSNNSKTIDDIVYNAPYYTIVWAAGNDRSDVGDGSKAADGPYNIIGPSGVSKNVITVGAITGFDEYIDLSSIEMSSFSSWGPTADGRIKPDLVADGVGLISASSSDTAAYNVKSGTSMASPNVTGTLGLIQEYYRQTADTFLTAAALKSVVIHTARDAGNEGPDVQFGWGSLNAVDALEIIKNRNAKDTLLIEATLINQGAYVTEIFSDGLTPITATLVWTDPPGNPGAAGNDNIMLVNDLDIRLVDDEGIEVFPWMLEISNPLVAITGDNIRDNVEKIQFSDVQPRRYRIMISHKGALVNLEQDFGLTITGGGIDSDAASEWYWVSGFGVFEETSNWSSNSGGVSQGTSSLMGSTVVFDNNSTLENGDIITLNNNLSVANFIWLNNKEVTIDLTGDTLSITGQFKINQDKLRFTNGVINYLSNKSEYVSLNFDGSDNLNFVINNQNNLELTSNININGLAILEGNVTVKNKNVVISNLNVGLNSVLFLSENDVTINKRVSLMAEDIRANDNLWKLDSVVMEIASPIFLDDVMEISGTTSLSGNFHIRKISNLAQVLYVKNYITVDSLLLHEGSLLSIFGADTLEVTKFLDINSNASSITSMIGENANSPSILKVNFREKLCFDFLVLSNLSFASDAVISAGLNSTLSNTLNILQIDCDELLYPNFTLSSNCSNSVIDIINLSEGDISSYEWIVEEGGTLLNTPNVESPEVYFNNDGVYSITLNISNQNDSQSLSSKIEIDSNFIAEVAIIENSEGLVSTKEGDSYQWYRNGRIMEGDTTRIMVPTETGNYQVAYYKNEDTCKNRISSPYNVVIAGINENIRKAQEISIFPNPFINSFMIRGVTIEDYIVVYDVFGNVIVEDIIQSDPYEVEFLDNSFGVYFVKISGKDYVIQKKILQVK